jgi:prepilin-type N-terminal cleavage/methylation domain-containing protein
MNITPKRVLSRGFTLIELLIVVIILAILAAIVIPQFANTTNDAREGALDANLSTLRSAVELYKIQHKNVYPATVPTGVAVGCTGTAGATGGGAQGMIDQLTMASDINGNTCSTASPSFGFGPYFRGTIPTEPINNKGSAVGEIAVTVAGAPLAPTVATGGWAFDSKSGQIVMNSNALDSKGVKYSAH